MKSIDDPTGGSLESRDTLTAGRSITAPTDSVSLGPDTLASYDLGAVIGRGGMGEVVLARDLRIGREVAIKRLTAEDPSDDSIARFVREARIQARLDHPAIVPVHELGCDAHGRPYFTMKRLAGTTLADLLAGGAQSLQRLLRAFIDAALAIGFAHARGIIHRDLKPGNIMLGDFGEVYVLDWGLARELARRAGTDPTDEPIEEPTGMTIAGAMLGTPGYMSPEQIHDASAVDRPTDCYALGAILFEMLAGETLHPRGEAIAHTVAGVDGSPRARRPDREIPPELDALCVLALAMDPAARPSARELAERVQSFLDGDRDLALRRDMAKVAVEHAHTALGTGRRGEAMRAAGRALALDPTSDAAEIVTRLMLEPPDVPPPELRAELHAAETVKTRTRASRAVFAYLGFLAVMPIVLWNGIESWSLFGSIYGLVIALACSAFMIARRPERSVREMWTYAVANVLMIALVSRVCSPFMVVPAFACVVLGSLVAYPAFANRMHAVIATVLMGWLAPIVLDITGLIPSSFETADGAFVIYSETIALGGASTTAMVAIVTGGTILAAGLLSGSQARASHVAQRQLLVQKWQLSQLLPVGER
jgi:serine/threonine-protein kinase